MRFLHSLILSTISVSAFAQVKVGSLTSLLEYADKHAPAALQAGLSPKMSKQDVNLQASGLYPKINVFGTGDYYPIIATQVIPAEVLGGKPGTYLKAQFGLPYVFAAGAELTMPVVNLEKWAQLSKSKSAYNQSQWNSKVALENFHIQLMQAYYQTLATKDVLSLNDENAETTAELTRIMADRYQNGVVNPSDFNRTKNLDIDVKNAGYNYTKQLQQAYNNLGAMLNLKEDSLQLSESLTDFKWPILQQLGDATARPGWKEADAKLKTAEFALRESRTGGLPRMSLTSRYVYNMQSKFETAGNNVEFNTANVGVRVDFPLFQGMYYRSSINKSKLQLQNAKLEQERVHANITQQQRDWFALYQAAFNKHTALQEKVQNASENLRIAKLNIKEGVMEFDEFNNIFTEYNRARMENLQNLADGILYYLLSTQNF
ncbi:MAG TPA: TolC family protein [Flavipsychrobacter sp.]|nr:TolC family protein [Flavipsychrobacter sp.]